jgi:hypothetical protein
MRLQDARIGYGGYSASLGAPGDRRRFCAYARQRGLRFEQARLAEDFDVVLLTHNADLTGWLGRKRAEPTRFKLIFELVDSYLVQRALGWRLLKGAARYVLGTDSRYGPDFLRTLEAMCRASDLVICSTEEQRRMIEPFNDKVVPSFDFFESDLSAAKTNYDRSGRLRIVWEGQAVTLSNLQLLREPLNALRDKVDLHVVTDPILYRRLGRYGAMPSERLLSGFECPWQLHPWNKATFSSLITDADLAVIPIDTRDPMMRGKPENKLVLLWQLAMPVLVSPTPAYLRATTGAGLSELCVEADQWTARLNEWVDAPANRFEALGRRGLDYASSHYSAQAFAGRFDAAFEAVGFKVAP